MEQAPDIDETGNAPRLTERQREVLARLDQRIPIKIIANDLAISESRVNQHIRALKSAFDAGDLSELVRKARLTGQVPGEGTDTPYRKPAYRKTQLPPAPESWDDGSGFENDHFGFADAASIHLDAPWANFEEPRIVPGLLDGRHSQVRRLVVMIGMAAGLAAAVILVITAALSLSEVLDGTASVPDSYGKAAD